jgi:hypothetical protein
MEKLEEAGNLANRLTVVRPYFEPGLYLGTSAFTAAGWEGKRLVNQSQGGVVLAQHVREPSV